MRLALASGVFWAAAVPATTVASNAIAIHFGKSFIKFSAGEALPAQSLEPLETYLPPTTA
jgi:hypothetical protein